MTSKAEIKSAMVSMDDAEDISFGAEDEVTRQGRLVHPIAVLFHVLFRSGAIIVYIICEIFSNSFIVNFVVVIVLLSLDFWTTKNITGRLLVGLRWWNHVDDEGKNLWVYESKKGKSQNSITATESRIFWLSVVACQVIWCLLILKALISFNLKWLMISIIGFLMSGANLYGYVRCKFGSNKKLGAAASNFIGQQVLRGVLSGKGAEPRT